MNDEPQSNSLTENASLIAVGIIALAAPVGFLLGLLCIGCLTTVKHERRKNTNPKPDSDTEAD